MITPPYCVLVYVLGQGVNEYMYVCASSLWINVVPPISFWRSHSWYLSPAPPAVLAYFFQAGVQFSARNARGTVLSEVSWDCAMFVDLKYQTYQPKTKYNHSNNKYSPKWHSVVLLQEGFCREFTHFLAYFFQASICAGVHKMTNIRYVDVMQYASIVIK